MLSILKFLDISNHDVSSIVLEQQKPFLTSFQITFFKILVFIEDGYDFGCSAEHFFFEGKGHS